MKTRMLIPVLLVTSLLAQTPPSTGSISGRVVDLETGTPLAGISVGSQSVGRAATDADGRYTLRNVSPGSVTVFVREANGGYTNMTLNLPKRVTVTSGRETTGVDFRVRMDAQISGRVLDENGEPVPGILVSVVQRLYSSVAPSIASSAVTDDRGVYVMTNNVFAGRDYYVLAQPSKRYANPISDLPAEPEARRRALVPTFYPSAGSVESAVAIIPKSLEHRTDVDIRMRKASNYCIAGVLHAGATPARMRFAIQDELVPTESPDGSGVPRPGGESAADGKIRVCDLYPGRFRLTAAQPASSSAFTSFSTVTTVTISNADVSGLNVLTIPPLTVAGEIVWDKPPGNASFKPVIGITQNPLPGGFSRPSAQATVPGEFTLTMVPTVDYSLSIVAPAPPGTPTGIPASTYVKDITYGGSSVVNGWIRTTDSSAKLRIVVGNDGGSIGVTAGRADGSPAAGTAILILPATARNEVELGATLKEAYADDTGSYQITNVPPGLYYVLATDDPPAAQTNLPTMRLSIAKTIENLNFLLRARSGGQLIEVRPGAAVQVRVTPKPLQ